MQVARPLTSSRVNARPGAIRRPLVVRAALPVPGSFDIGAAPVKDFIPAGPWKVLDGNCATAKGFKCTGLSGGLRKAGDKADLALIVSETEAAAAGVFTQNVMCAAPVTYCKQMLAETMTARAVLVNAGQANAATGEQGWQDSLASAKALADKLGVAPNKVLLQSTGVIGQRIKIDKMIEALPILVSSLGTSHEDGHRASVAITTTDLVSKSAALELQIGGKTVSLGGMCKGSGMIHPNMATMLGVVTCDAAVDPAVWRGMLQRCIRDTFNQISVDGDTSTNDCVIALASGKAGNELIKDANSDDGKLLESALKALLQGMCKSIAWDGEGATALIEVEVSGAANDDDARKCARSVVCSSLFKAAVFGHDPNWGRIACAAGYSGVKFDQNDMDITMGTMPLMAKGQPLPFDKVAATTYLKETCAKRGTVVVKINIGAGKGHGIAWGCDLSYEYVKINGEYTT